MQEDAPDFRDKISTVDAKGKRKWMYVFQPSGKFYRWRTIVSIVYLILFFSLPFIKINHNPAFQFNLPEAKFILFGQVFLPQDFILFGMGMLVFLLFIVVFTLIFGRVFCGWACPQTIFLEMVFRRIEYWIEGPANKQEAADHKEWSFELIGRKFAKHVIFFFLSFVIANMFLAYIIGVDELYKIITEPVSEHVTGFAMIVLFTIAFYAVYAFVREIVCTVICPYGRLQSVLLDKNTIVVAYDYVRGEPRARATRHKLEVVGDCIDCDLCVKVCPTGIDIRNGTQLECVNCTACIDACNSMMEKVNRPLNLIRYASENNIANREKFHFSYRIKMYSAVLIILVGVLIGLIATRKMFDATILRVPGQILQENPDGTLSNLYRIKIVNKNTTKQPYDLKVDDAYAKIAYVGKHLDSLEPGDQKEEMFFIKVPKEHVTKRKERYRIFIMRGERIVQRKKVTFIGEY